MNQVTILLLLLSLLTPAILPGAEKQADIMFTDYFENRTMRVDYFHSGDADGEQFALDEILCDGPWPGSTKNLHDHLDLGLYRLLVLDPESGRIIFSQGFASIFGEWQTIDAARREWGTFHESVRFPWPRNKVLLRIDKRDRENVFQPVWSREIDPADRGVNKAEASSPFKSFSIWGDDDPHHRLDIVFLGDGYRAEEMEKFRNDARRLAGELLAAEPYRSLKDKITIRGVETPAALSGVSRPHDGIYRRSPLGMTYSFFDSQRYAMTTDNKPVRDAAAVVPYDFKVILINESTYGGGGIHNLYAAVAADNAFSDYIVIHEMGHHLAALADEYYTSAVAYETESPITAEPWEKNISAFLDGRIKWADLIRPGLPLPTPWDQDAFERHGREVEKQRAALRARGAPESEMEELFRNQRRREQELFAKQKYRNETGLFEGANYRASGYFRPSLDCIMFTRSMKFCPVCRETIARVIEAYSN